MKTSFWPGPLFARRDVRQVLDVVVEGRDVELLQRLRREGLHRDRHVLHVLAAPLRGDGDFRQRVRTRAGGRGGLACSAVGAMAVRRRRCRMAATAYEIFEFMFLTRLSDLRHQQARSVLDLRLRSARPDAY